MGDVMAEIELSAGPVLYEDTGGDGPLIALLHGLMTASLWDEVVEELDDVTRAGRLVLASCETYDNYPPGRVVALGERQGSRDDG
jgi:hypothetical protein